MECYPSSLPNKTIDLDQNYYCKVCYLLLCPMIQHYFIWQETSIVFRKVLNLNNCPFRQEIDSLVTYVAGVVNIMLVSRKSLQFLFECTCKAPYPQAKFSFLFPLYTHNQIFQMLILYCVSLLRTINIFQQTFFATMSLINI